VIISEHKCKGAIEISALFDLLLTNREELGVDMTTGSSWAAEITS